MTYPNEIRLFYSENIREDLVGLDKSISGVVKPISSKPKTLLDVVDGKNLHFTPRPLREYPVQLEVSPIYGRKHTGPGFHVDEVDGFDALYILIKRYKRKDGTLAEVFILESFAEDVNGMWNRLRFGEYDREIDKPNPNLPLEIRIVRDWMLESEETKEKWFKGQEE